MTPLVSDSFYKGTCHWVKNMNAKALGLTERQGQSGGGEGETDRKWYGESEIAVGKKTVQNEELRDMKSVITLFYLFQSLSHLSLISL